MAEKNRIRLSVGQKLNRASIKNNTAIITTAAASQDDPKHIIVQGAGGLKGETGPQGEPGQAATITVGSTTTLDAGSSATVENSGTSTDAVLNFGIPKGEKGDTGATGPANTLSIGTVEKGDTAGATITGTAPNQTLNLTLPKGDKGDTGTAATVTAGTTTTLPAGSNASVTNSGTTSAAVFDFSIPRGDKGDTGTAATIAVGNTTTLPSGSSATVTNTGTSSAAVFDFGIPKGDAADPPESYKTVSGNPITMPDAGPSIKSLNKIDGDTTQIANPNYTQVEWLGATGTQYIDTGVKPNNTLKTICNLTLNNNYAFAEGRAGQYVSFGILNHTSAYRARIRNGSGSNVDSASTVPTGDGVFHNFELSQADGFWIDGVRIGTFNSYTYTDTNSLYLFAFNSNGAPLSGSYATGKIKRMKLYDNGSLVRDFVPAIRNFDNVAGMYDLVNDTFYTNAGTGTFTTGNEIVQPTPEFPETIQTVTGEQTITVSNGANQSQSLTVDLGSIELCKIGTYQDYIYKSGDDWYIHKEIVKGVLDGSETWQYPSSSASYTYFQLYYTNFANKYGARFADLLNPAGAIMADKFVCITDPTNAEGLSIYGSWFRITVPNSIATTETALNNWLANNNVAFYCWMQTPTDTKITNADLIDDLNALNEADLFDGPTTLTVSATSPNLPASLDLDYWTWFKGEAGSGGGNYTAGTGLNLVGHQFSVDTTVIAEKTDIPTVNNATLTIQKNGSDVATFTANSSTNATANISVPTQTSLLTNDGADGDSRYVELDELSTVATSGNYNNLSNKPVYPLLTATYNSNTNRYEVTTGDSLSTIADGTKFSIMFATGPGASWAYTMAIDSVVVGLMTKCVTNIEPASVHALTSVDQTIVYEFTKQTIVSDPFLICTNVFEKIGTSDIDTAAVTSSNIDWTTMAEITESGTNPTAGGAGNYQMCIRYPNGIQIISGYYSDDAILYKNNTADKTVIFTKPFSALPNVVVGLQTDSTSPDLGNITVSTCTTTTTQFIARCFYYNAGSAGRRPAIRWTAIGRWDTTS